MAIRPTGNVRGPPADRLPYDFSPARLRCMELTEEIAAHESPAGA